MPRKRTLPTAAIWAGSFPSSPPTRRPYESHLSGDGSGADYFARSGETYYVLWFPTDVRIPDQERASHYSGLMQAVAGDALERNGWSANDEDAFFAQDYTYDSAHATVEYAPYGPSDERRWTLTLSRPRHRRARRHLVRGALERRREHLCHLPRPDRRYLRPGLLRSGADELRRRRGGLCRMEHSPGRSPELAAGSHGPGRRSGKT